MHKQPIGILLVIKMETLLERYFEKLYESTKTDRGHAYMNRHGIHNTNTLIDHIANHKILKKYHDPHASYDDVHVRIPAGILKKHTGIDKKHIEHIDNRTDAYEGWASHDGEHVMIGGGA